MRLTNSLTSVALCGGGAAALVVGWHLARAGKLGANVQDWADGLATFRRPPPAGTNLIAGDGDAVVTKQRTYCGPPFAAEGDLTKQNSLFHDQMAAYQWQW